MKSTKHSNNRKETVWKAVSDLYTESEMPAAAWMWQTHVQIVAQKAEEIAIQVKANIEQVVVAALLHDVADTKLLRTDKDHDNESKLIAQSILNDAGFSKNEITQIIEDILETHSAYPENMPKTLAAQVVSTADAFGHLGTDFYTDMTVERLRLFGLDFTLEQRKAWILKKIERDFKSKVFFNFMRDELKPAYERIKAQYSN